MKGCVCIAAIDIMLAGSHQAVCSTISANPIAIVETVKLASAPKRGWRGRTLAATFCPFCGKKYPQ